MSLLDTNVVSIFLSADAPHRYPKLYGTVERLRQTGGIAISFVTLFELRRGFEKLMRQGDNRRREGRKKLIALEKFIEQVDVLGLDEDGGEGWTRAAEYWGDAQTQN